MSSLLVKTSLFCLYGYVGGAIPKLRLRLPPGLDSRFRGNDKGDSGNDKGDSGNDKGDSGNDSAIAGIIG